MRLNIFSGVRDYLEWQLHFFKDMIDSQQFVVYNFATEVA